MEMFLYALWSPRLRETSLIVPVSKEGNWC